MKTFLGQFQENSELENKKNKFLFYFYAGLLSILTFLLIYDSFIQNYQFVPSHIARIIVLLIALWALSQNKGGASLVFTVTLFLPTVIYNSFSEPSYCYDSLILFPLCVGMFSVVRNFIYNFLYLGASILIFCYAEKFKLYHQNPAFGFGEIFAVAITFICFFAAMSFILFEFKYYERMLQLKNKNLTNIVGELEQKNNKLEESNQFINQIVSVIAHDLRSPFNTLIGYSSLLHNNYSRYDSTKQKQFIEQILSCSQNGYQVLENLLNWAQFSAGRIDLAINRLNIYDIVNEILSELNFAIEQKEIIVVPEIATNLFWNTDKMLFSSIIRNLLSNSIKFSSKSSSVRLVAEERDNNLEIVIENYGLPIPEDMQKKILDPTHAFSTTGTEGEKGTGIGLIICQNFITQLKGSMKLKSTTESTEFRIAFPNMEYSIAK